MRPLGPISEVRGFTLIELVAVIVILGIVAATAMPRFTDLPRDARIATVNQMAAALHEAAQTFRAKCSMSPTCDVNEPYWNGGTLNTKAEVVINGVLYRGQYGYPWRDAGSTGLGIATLVQLNGFTNYYSVPLGRSNTPLGLDGAPDPYHCSATYRNDLTAPATTTTSYTVTVDTSGC